MDVAETRVETGLEYTEGEPLRVRVRQRGRRYDLLDDGRAGRYDALFELE
jgi:hypothetical protein